MGHGLFNNATSADLRPIDVPAGRAMWPSAASSPAGHERTLAHDRCR